MISGVSGMSDLVIDKDHLFSVVHTACGPGELNHLESRFKLLNDRQLAYMARALGLAEDASWQDCVDAARYWKWVDVINTYEYETGRSF